MSRTIARDNRQDKILSLIDGLCDLGRDLAKEIAITWLASRDDQAETSARIVTETLPVPVISDNRELSVKELAERWGVSTRSIYEWKTTGGLKFKKVGRLIRFDPIEADLWAKRHQESFTRARLRVVK